MKIHNDRFARSTWETPNLGYNEVSSERKYLII